MGTISDIPNSYEEALELFNTRRKKDYKPVCSNTYLYERRMNTPKTENAHALALRYYDTDIITWAEDRYAKLEPFASPSTNDRYAAAGMPRIGTTGNEYIQQRERWFVGGYYLHGVPFGEIWVHGWGHFVGMAEGRKVVEPMDLVSVLDTDEKRRFMQAKKYVLKRLRPLLGALATGMQGARALQGTPKVIDPDFIVDFAAMLQANPEYNLLSFMHDHTVHRQYADLKWLVESIEWTKPSTLLGRHHFADVQGPTTSVDFEDLTRDYTEKLVRLYYTRTVYSSRLPVGNRTMTEEEVDQAAVE